MKINHRITARHDNPFWSEIDRLGIDYEHGDPNNVLGFAISVLNVTEDQPQWPEIERLVAKCDLGHHLVTNIFTKAEMNLGEWFILSARGHHGYPQPEDDFSYIEATYDISNYCRHCGIGGKQNNPFRLRTEPKARHSQFVQLNWVFDEFFVRCEAREGLLASGLTGIDFVPAILHTKSLQYTEVEQLRVLSQLPPALDSSGLQTVTCKEHNEEWESIKRRFPKYQDASLNENPFCGRVKYHLMHRGQMRFERTAFHDVPDVVKSHEWFGSGANAFQLVLVSQRFRQVVEKAKWRGVEFEPVELMSQPERVETDSAGR